MIVIKCGVNNYEKADMVKLCEPYITVGELRERLKWFDKDEAVCVDTLDRNYPFRCIEEFVED